MMATIASAHAASCDASKGEPPPPSSKAAPVDLLVTGDCPIGAGEYFYGQVNIVANGKLLFQESDAPNTPTAFSASSIVIENGGALIAGRPDKPFGSNANTLTIYLYGADQSNGNPTTKPGQGVRCQSPVNNDPVNGTGPCGIPIGAWTSNGDKKVTLPGGVSDYFYQYGPLYGDNLCTNGQTWSSDKGCSGSGTPGEVGYFGYKVLAVSYGGTLQLFGYKGACYNTLACDPKLTHAGWTRLRGSVSPGDGTADRPLVVDAPSNYNPENTSFYANDQIVVTTTDYLPGHSETFTVRSVTQKLTHDGGWIQELVLDHPVQFPHNGERYTLDNRLAAAQGRLTLDPDLVRYGVETRAAVALLNRSIRLVSSGDAAGDEFPPSTPEAPCTALDGKGPCYSFGGHMVIRQGFQAVQIQGVEFKQLGQGGRLGHYPVHFHMARQTPASTTIRDSTVNESMTRWMVLHSTQGVTLAGNVGYKSIGHGFYLEDGTETDNNLYANLGIFARGAVANDQNPRRIPGILADNHGPFTAPDVSNQGFPYRSDNEYPTAFWITNGWNDFIGNMAAGAGTCGACYWLVPAENDDMPDVPNPNLPAADRMHMQWTGYSALQKNSGFAGVTPLKSFYRNTCTTAMHSFQTTADAPACNGVIAAGDTTKYDTAMLRGVQSIAPAATRQTVTPTPPAPPYTAPDNENDPYYPRVLAGSRRAVRCPPVAGQPGQYDCTEVQPGGQNVVPCGAGTNGEAAEDCAVTVLDHYTSSFTWANGNVSAVWLRPQWYLLDNSVLTDVQNGALTFVSGGDYTHSSLVPGYWAVARNTVFIGNTQTGNQFAANDGPFNKASSVHCDNGLSPGGFCLNAKEGVSFPLANYFVNQRMFNIYDGPTYQDSNIYLDITTSPCKGDDCVYGLNTQGVRRNPLDASCYLPNAAIAWKQPNGFYYPPAFHSTNLFFDNVDIRHYVIAPLFKAADGVTPDQNFGQGGTYFTDLDGVTVNGTKTVQGVADAYCGALGSTGKPGESTFFNGFTGIDRQTELNDDDGSLTGLSNSVAQTTPPTPLKQTISVNEDNFFSAPVETAECASNIGVLASKACQTPSVKDPAVTARTSPYDYVGTVVYRQPDGGTWDSECSNETCYGVPLYRQFLTGKKGSDEASSTGEWAHWFHNGCNADPKTPQCRWPFIRMAGAHISQRNTLTVNNGTYYLETTVPLDTQKTENYTVNKNFYNVFQGGQTYYVFFLYAKQSTRQTYQIYVGDTFNATNDISALHMKIPDKDFQPNPIATRPGWLQVAKLGTDGPGILTVTIDFNGVTELDPTPANGLCRPHTFCSPQADNTCGCALKQDDPLVRANPGMLKECNKVCSSWAVKDLDCPKDGCLGFSFTLPATGFTADGVLTHRPMPTEFPKVADPNHLPDWKTAFERTGTLPEKTAGTCHYPDPLPGSCPAAH